MELGALRACQVCVQCTWWVFVRRLEAPEREVDSEDDSGEDLEPLGDGV